MINNIHIELMFPTPLIITNLDRNFTQQELNFVKKCKNNCCNNFGNLTSNDNYVLENPEFKDLKQFCLEAVNIMIKEAYQPKEKIEPYITQSWLNFTEHKGYHHLHNHSNSFISGVLYINSDIDKDKIQFYRNEYMQLQIESPSNNIYYNSYTLPVNTGKLILFPSSTMHQVPKTTNKKTRISLAFNTFIKGNLGNNKGLTELKLEKNNI